MKRSMVTAAVLLMLMPAFVSAQPEDGLAAPGDWRIYLGAGAGRWQTLRDAEAANGGRFDATSFMVQMGIDRAVRETGASGLYVGLDLGLLTTSSNIPGRYTDLTSQAYWIGPALTWRLGRLSGLNLSFRGGIGYYGVDLNEIMEFETGGFSSFIEVNEAWSSTSVGGSVGLRLDVPFSGGRHGNSLYIDLSGHMFDFGSPSRSGGTLDGPLWTAQAGWAHRY